MMNTAPARNNAFDSDEATRNLFVAGLCPWVNDKAIREIFEGYGNILSAKVMLDIHSGHSRGFGFVLFESVENAAKAKAELDETVNNSSRLHIRYSPHSGDNLLLQVPNLYVRNVPAYVGESQLRDLFASKGDLKLMTMRPDTTPKDKGGHGGTQMADRKTVVVYLEYDTYQTAQKVVDELHGANLFPGEPVPILAKMAEPPHLRNFRRQKFRAEHTVQAKVQSGTKFNQDQQAENPQQGGVHQYSGQAPAGTQYSPMMPPGSFNQQANVPPPPHFQQYQQQQQQQQQQQGGQQMGTMPPMYPQQQQQGGGGEYNNSQHQQIPSQYQGFAQQSQQQPQQQQQQQQNWNNQGGYSNQHSGGYHHPSTPFATAASPQQMNQQMPPTTTTSNSQQQQMQQHYVQQQQQQQVFQQYNGANNQGGNQQWGTAAATPVIYATPQQVAQHQGGQQSYLLQHHQGGQQHHQYHQQQGHLMMSPQQQGAPVMLTPQQVAGGQMILTQHPPVDHSRTTTVPSASGGVVANGGINTTSSQPTSPVEGAQTTTTMMAQNGQVVYQLPQMSPHQTLTPQPLFMLQPTNQTPITTGGAGATVIPAPIPGAETNVNPVFLVPQQQQQQQAQFVQQQATLLPQIEQSPKQGLEPSSSM